MSYLIPAVSEKMQLANQKRAIRLRNAWKVAKNLNLKRISKDCFVSLEAALKIGKVRIMHPKVKGGFSEHIATRNPDLIPNEFAPKTEKQNDNEKKTIAYFALDILAWRSVSLTLLSQTTFEII